MNMAIDRAAIIKAIYKGAATPMSVWVTMTGSDKLPPIPYDPKKAKELLVEAGYPNGFNVTLLATNDFAPAFEIPEIMEITAAYFKAIGLNPTIKMMDRASMLRMVSEAKDPGMVIAWRTSYRPSVSGQFYDKFYPNGESNLHFTSEELVLWLTSMRRSWISQQGLLPWRKYVTIFMIIGHYTNGHGLLIVGVQRCGSGRMAQERISNGTHV